MLTRGKFNLYPHEACKKYYLLFCINNQHTALLVEGLHRGQMQEASLMITKLKTVYYWFFEFSINIAGSK